MSVYKRALRTFDSASLTGAFQNVGTQVPFSTLALSITNTSDVDVLITDGSNEDDLRVAAGGTLSLGVGNTNGQRDSLVPFAGNVQLQIKQVTAAGTGDIVVMCFG